MAIPHFFEGRVGEIPTVNVTGAGRSVVNFPLAENHYKVDESGKTVHDKALWFDVTKWCADAEEAEMLRDSLRKNDHVVIIVREILPSSWRSAGSNEPRVGIKVIASEIFLNVAQLTPLDEESSDTEGEAAPETTPT